ncbi:flagellar hook-associated protein 3 FlgL [Rhodobacter sp. JA431]|uniref:flagellin n=1 Tax=Rhodobacter sp. JA431 TaxID=570013 RepID=UPI000BD19A26|nr:flagellin [Rhodobacter sp. JA431]SOC07919.1 flagellar hook-associated protein 3 FlgL [Rhodobacter sp. JA431]
MKYMSVGDMAQTYMMRNHNVQLKNTMTKLSNELVTGVTSDVGAAVGGDFTALAAIERSISRSAIFDQVAVEANLVASTQQSALEVIQGHAEEIGNTLAAATTATSPAIVTSGTKDAEIRFESTLDALNSNVAGRYVMSGNTTDTRPVADSTTIITALKAEISGLTVPTDIANAVDAWFDQPAGGGGFLDVAYLGSATSLSPVQISDTDQAQLSMTAADNRIRDVLKGFALATLVAQDAVPNDDYTRATIAGLAGTRILTGSSELTTARAEIGTVEGIIETAKTRNAAQLSALEISKKEMIGVDPYDGATALEAVQSQLETLYTLTTRVAQLSLTDYM